MSTTNDGGGPAFPTDISDHPDGLTGYATCHLPGMSLRDYFAAKAMQGICASGPIIPDVLTASEAYGLADAMLKARVA